MKKLFLLLTATGLALGTVAQQRASRYSGFPEMQPAPAGMMAPDGPSSGPEGTTATPFYTETFGSGTNTTLPTGWLATGNAQQAATWKWRRQALTGQFGASLGVLNSPTGGAATLSTNNGWMVYDSDSIGDLNPTALPLEGYLTSPLINCTGHSTVQLSFYQWFRRFRDSCYVDVSNNGGGTWTRFSVLPNNTMAITNTNLPTNPTYTRINVSSVAANQANVRVRFYYKLDQNTGAGGAFAWFVDDVEMAELDPVELGVDNTTWLMRLGPGRGFTSFGQYPRQLVDSIYPVGFVTNFGSGAQSNASFTGRIFRNGSQVYSQSMVYTTPANAVDSAVNLTRRPGYQPTDTGLHTVVFSVSQTGDAYAPNNTDTVTNAFRISDSVLSMNVGLRSSTSYYVQRPSTNANGVGYNHIGVFFEIPQGRSDTLTSVQVAVTNTTTIGATLQAQVYKFDGTDYQPYCETVTRTIASADRSTTTAIVLINLPLDNTSQYQQRVLDSGSYAAVIRGVGNDDDSTILIPGFESPAQKLGTAYEYGAISESDNAPLSYSFGVDGPFFLPNFTPVVRPVFGRVVPVGVKNVRLATLGAAYPNPANTTVAIPVSLSAGSDVAVTLTNAQGQILARQELGKQAAGRSFEITFPTGALANGVYFYTVEAAGEKTTGRVVVTH